MKKIIPIAFISFATITTLYADDNCCKQKYNNITYTTQAETNIKSNSILVQVIGYATTTLQDQNKVEQNISDSIKNIVNADWKVKNVQQNKSQSGALNITLDLQARISQPDLNKLQTALENQKSSSQKLVVKVLDYNPPATAVEQAKQNLRIKIYNDTKNYLEKFNKETNSNYMIQSIRYNDYNVYTPRTNNVMLMKASNADFATAESAPSVSQDITIKANVTFAKE